MRIFTVSAIRLMKQAITIHIYGTDIGNKIDIPIKKSLTQLNTFLP